jgi:hypothetical protein
MTSPLRRNDGLSKLFWLFGLGWAIGFAIVSIAYVLGQPAEVRLSPGVLIPGTALYLVGGAICGTAHVALLRAAARLRKVYEIQPWRSVASALLTLPLTWVALSTLDAISPPGDTLWVLVSVVLAALLATAISGISRPGHWKR